jgi:predicted nucleic acid-binding protein
VIEVVCDASVVVGWLEPDDTESGALLEAAIRGACRLLVLDLTLYEVGNVLVRKHARSGAEVATVIRGIETVADVARPDGLVLRDAACIADADRLTFYDAAYAAQAVALGAVLATRDSDFLDRGLGLPPATVLELLPA